MAGWQAAQEGRKERLLVQAQQLYHCRTGTAVLPLFTSLLGACGGLAGHPLLEPAQAGGKAGLWWVE